MRRREFITLLGGATVAWPLAASAQQAKLPRIGILWPSPLSSSGHFLDAFRQGLHELGYVEGQNMTIEFRSAATPGLPDFIFAALQDNAGIKLTQVSYREFAPALQDLGEGRIQVAVTGLSLLLPQVQAGKARLLMVTNAERAPVAPEVPTAQEAGYPDLTFSGVVGFYGWREISTELKERIAVDVRVVGADPGISARVKDLGSVVHVDTPKGFTAAIEEQRAKIAAIHQMMMRPT
jgi:tripartite-type tricarboxylate transporter receptor subunit TctC